jgi:hypothetical protein
MAMRQHTVRCALLLACAIYATAEEDPEWPKFTAEAQRYLAFASEGAAAKSGMRREFCEVFVQSLRPRAAK